MPGFGFGVLRALLAQDMAPPCYPCSYITPKGVHELLSGGGRGCMLQSIVCLQLYNLCPLSPLRSRRDLSVSGAVWYLTVFTCVALRETLHLRRAVSLKRGNENVYYSTGRNK